MRSLKKSISAHKRLKKYYFYLKPNKNNTIKWLYHINCIFALEEKKNPLTSAEKKLIFAKAVKDYY